MTPDSSLEARAHRRVRLKIGFFIHALVYLLVNGGLYLMAVAGSPRGIELPMLGWALGLAIHGAVVFLGLQTDGLRRSMIEREKETLRRLDDPA